MESLFQHTSQQTEIKLEDSIFLCILEQTKHIPAVYSNQKKSIYQQVFFLRRGYVNRVQNSHLKKFIS